MTKFSKTFFLLLMKYEHVADVVVEYYSCATCARGVGGGLNGRGCREGHRGASCSQIQTYAIFVQFFVVFMCYTLVYYI